ncbi:MAG: hypothetical protein JWN86_4473 [Planctomycetota bacterium]|nr:hypothetical protein [Planctomycetota bacterium]
MRMPRLRFTVRRMMAAVAIAAIVFTAIILKTRHAHYRQRADYHAGMEGYARKILEGRSAGAWPSGRLATEWVASLVPSGPAISGGRVRYRVGFHQDYTEAIQERHAAEKQYGRIILFHELRRKKYERAARYPWLPVAPDPPETE